MKQTMRAVTMCVVALAMTGAAQAPRTSREMRERAISLMQQRLDDHLPMRLSADTLTLVGDELRLSGHVRIWFDDMSLFTNRAVVHRDTNRIEWSGGGRINLPPPRIEFR